MLAKEPSLLCRGAGKDKLKNLSNEYIGKINNKEVKISLQTTECDEIQITIIDEMDSYSGKYSLQDLKEQNKYFKMFDKLEEVYSELSSIFIDNIYSLKEDGNNIIINIEIGQKPKQNNISLVLSKGEISKDDMLKILFSLTTQFIKENKDLKATINNMNNKIDKLQQKLDSMEENFMNFIQGVGEEEGAQEEGNNFGNILKNSKIIDNDEQIENIKKWIPAKNKENLKCELIYDAKKDGDTAKTYHELCDGKEQLLILISTNNQLKIGGYISKPFGGNKGFMTDNDSFLFDLNYNEKYPSMKQGFNYQDKATLGPIFGSYCIYINDKFLTNCENFYNSYTARFDFGKRNSNNNRIRFKVIDLEVYQISENDDLFNLI